MSILPKAVSDNQLQAIVDEGIGRMRLPPLPLANIRSVIGLTFKQSKSRSSPFGLGFLFGRPIGLIYVPREWFVLPREEMRFIVFHELGHITLGHSVSGIFTALAKESLLNILADIFDLSRRSLDFRIGLLKFIWWLLTRTRSIEEEITAQKELAADDWAVRLQGNKQPALSFFERIAQGNYELPTHHTETGGFRVPAISIRERIEAIHRLDL